MMITNGVQVIKISLLFLQLIGGNRDFVIAECENFSERINKMTVKRNCNGQKQN